MAAAFCGWMRDPEKLWYNTLIPGNVFYASYPVHIAILAVLAAVPGQ